MGRIARLNFFLSSITIGIVGFVIFYVAVVAYSHLMQEQQAFVTMQILATVFLIPLAARRFHDLNVTGWCTLALFIPEFLQFLSFLGVSWVDGPLLLSTVKLLELGLFLILWLVPGVEGQNAYGPAPSKKLDILQTIFPPLVHK